MTQELSEKEQNHLDDYLINAASIGETRTVRLVLASGADVHAHEDGALRLAALDGHTETVQVLLAAGADAHAHGDYALRWAAYKGHTETMKVLLAEGANVHAHDDEAVRWASHRGLTETVQVLAANIFDADSWCGKSRAEIETVAAALYERIKANNPQNPITPERLRTAGAILLDCALTCWEQVRPPPPKLQISPLPAQPRPV